MQVARLPGVRRAIQAAGPIKRDVVLFDSWGGRFSDSPRAVSEELHRRGADIEHVWVLDEAGRADAPGWATAVRPQSTGHLQHLGRARYVVANNSLPGYFRKRAGSTYLQTWHGTPLKRIAFDIENPTFAGAEQYLRTLRGDVAVWDLLVSPNRFSTDILRRAFDYNGEVIETGYPRNDLLSSPRATSVRDSVRASLGIEPGQRAVLYAPTWRDHTTFSLQLGLGEIADALGHGYRVLIRAHQLDATRVELSGQARVTDVSAIGDIRELYLASDVLVTDYSSVMFDFAVTRKPMLFFTYDLDEYRDRLRGFYFDFEAEAPGPLLSTTGEVIQGLRDLDVVSERHRSAYERFHERFCHLEDGNASVRVADALLAA